MGLHQDILSEPITELGLRELQTVKSTHAVSQAVTLMRRSHIGCVIVVDDAGRPIGKFTERHLMQIIKDPDKLSDPVERHATACHATVTATDPIQKLLDVMTHSDARFVCVVDDNGKAIALTGPKGVIEYITERFPRVIKVQMMEAKLHYDQREGA